MDGENFFRATPGLGDEALCQRLMDQLLHAQGGLEGDAVERRWGSVLHAFQRGFAQARSRIGSALS